MRLRSCLLRLIVVATALLGGVPASVTQASTPAQPGQPCDDPGEERRVGARKERRSGHNDQGPFVRCEYNWTVGEYQWRPIKANVPAEGELCSRVGSRGKNDIVPLRCSTVGKVKRWVRDKEPASATGVPVIDGLPFARTLPAGLTIDGVVAQLALDMTALMTCLDWATEQNNRGEPFVYSTGPRTRSCNKAVWGTPNAYESRAKGTLSLEKYLAPMDAIWEKYESYGAVLFHPFCPEGDGIFLFSVCRGLPVEHESYCGVGKTRNICKVAGTQYSTHRFYRALRVEYEGESRRLQSIERLEHFLIYYKLPLDYLTRFGYPGCPLSDIRERGCRMYYPSP